MQATQAPPVEGQEAGNGDVPLEGEQEQEQVVRRRVVIEGDGQLSLAVGGKKPTDSEVKITGGSIGYEGQLQKGETIALVVHARVSKVEFVDKIDSKTGDVVQTIRRHGLRIEGATPVNGEE